MKHIKRLLKTRNSAGFTLVEIIVALSLLAILMMGMVIAISPILQTLGDTNKLLTAENVATIMDEYITRTMRNASEIAVFTNASYGDSNTNAAITGQVAAMKAYCDKLNGSLVGENKTHELKCLSLRCIDGRYYLCNEPLSPSTCLPTGNDVSDVKDLKGKVFSDCLYKDLYMDFTFSMALVKENDGGTVKEVQSKDTMKLDIKAYTDAAHNDLVFNGTGITELRQIKTQLRGGAKETDFFMNIINAGGTDDAHKDIYIFYVTRRLIGVNA